MSFAIVSSKSSVYNYNLIVDFESDFGSTQSIVAATCTASVMSGVDATPANLLSGSPSFSGSIVTQVLTGGIPGVVYQVVLTATSNNQMLSKTVLVSVTVTGVSATDALSATLGGTPVAAFSSVVTGLSVSFTDASTDSGGTISSWSWSFGDGSSSNGQNPTHVYAATGTFSASLTITDSYSGRTSTVTNSVVISAAAGGVVSPPGWASATYNTYGHSPGPTANASLQMSINSNGTWTVQNYVGAVLASGNWYYPTTAGIGASYKVEFTPTLSVTGSDWTLTNPASSATAINSGLTLIMLESGNAPSGDATSGTVVAAITPVSAGGSSTGTFNFSIAILTNLGPGPGSP